MQTIKQYAPWVIIISLVILLILQRCSHREPVIKIQEKHDTIRDTTIRKVIISEPYPLEIGLPPDTFVYVPDSSELLRQYRSLQKLYYASAVYLDTLLNDTTALITLRDTVTQNRLQQRGLTFINRKPTIINTTIIQNESRFKMYIGLAVGGWTDKFSISPSILFQTKSDVVTGAHFDLINKIAAVDFYWKISFRNKNPPP